MKRTLAALSLALVALAAAADAADRRAATIADLYRVKGVAEPAIAPDGRSVAFAVTTTDASARSWRKHRGARSG